MTWTDIWCFTCSHEINRNIDGSYDHVEPDEEADCVCTKDDLGCEPR